MQSHKILARGMIIFLAATAFTKLISYFYRAVISRWLGPGAYGLFSLGVALFTLIASIIVTAVSLVISRSVAFYRGKHDELRARGIVTHGVFFVFVLSLILAFFLYKGSSFLATHLHHPDLLPLLEILAFAFPFYILILVLQKVMEGYQRIGLSVFVQVILNALKIILVIISLLLGYEVLGVTLTYTLALVLTGLLAVVLCEVKGIALFPRQRIPMTFRSDVRELLLSSWPLVVAFIVHSFMTWGDTVILGFFRTTEEVGVYNIVTPTANLLTLPVFTADAVLLPLLSTLFSAGKTSELIQLYKTATKWIFLLTLPLFLLLLLFPRHILHVVAGDAYVGGTLALVFTTIGVLIMSLAAPSNMILLSVNKTHLMMKNSLFAAVVNILLNIFLIPRYGMNGAAIAFLLTSLLIFLLRVYEAHILISSHPFSLHLGRVLLSGFITGVLVYGLSLLLLPLFPWNILVLLVNAFLIGIFYLSFLYIFRCFDVYDKDVIRTIKQKLLQKSHMRL